VNLFALITTVLLFCPPAQASTAAGQEFLLFYSNDVNGETAPCG